MPASTPFFPSLRSSPSPTSPRDIVTDTCAALGPQLQAWREAPAERASEEAIRLEEWIQDQDEKVARAASDLLWGKRPIPTAAALTAARRTHHADGRTEGYKEKLAGRIVCRSVEVADEAEGSFEDAFYADSATAERARKTEAEKSHESEGKDYDDKKNQKMSFMDEILDAWNRPERHMFALKLLVFVLVMLCMIELGEDIFIWIRRRRNSHRGTVRCSGDEKAWYKPGLESISEVEEEDDTQLP